jgi:hypothetical protein
MSTYSPRARCLVVLSIALTLVCGVSAQETQISGSVGLYGKFNSNLTLIDEKKTNLDQKDAPIAEVRGELNIARSWGPDWFLDWEVSSQGNAHGEHGEENWYFNRSYLSLGRVLGENALNFSSEIRHFGQPDDNRLDFFRHTGIFSYKHTFSPLWQLRAGVQNTLTRYPHTSTLNYRVNGAFVELNNTWSNNFSTYYSLDLQLYAGTADPRENNPNAVPEDGMRQTLRAGLDWHLSGHRLLSGTYMLQNDNSGQDEKYYGSTLSSGEFEGREESQDSEAEFDLHKHKFTLLYSHRFNPRLTLALYEELIYKYWEDEEGPIVVEARDDLLFLSSAFLKYKWRDSVRLRLRYLFRMNESTANANDYVDHIVFAGPEFRF